MPRRPCEESEDHHTTNGIRHQFEWALKHAGGRCYFLDPSRSEHIVGRPDYYSGVFPSVDLSQLDARRYVSRRHAMILLRACGWLLRAEYAAVNSTFVNGRRLRPGECVVIANHDLLRFANVELEVIRAEAD